MYEVPRPVNINSTADAINHLPVAVQKVNIGVKKKMSRILYICIPFLWAMTPRGAAASPIAPARPAVTSAVAPAHPISDSTQATAAARAFAEMDSACAAPRAWLWGRTLRGPLLFVNPTTREVFADRPDTGGLLRPVGTVFAGVLPPAVSIANTSADWGGRRWAMVLLPLPADRTQRLDLLLHESFHRIQDSLGLPQTSPIVGFLDSREGRTWLRLELEALARALSRPVGDRAYDLQSALLFRAQRYALHPKEDSLEHALEWNEGLAEFTGTYASGADLDTAYLPGLVRNDTARPSFTRAFAYFTGPLYGILLSQRRPDWPRHITATDSFGELIREVYGLPVAGAPLSTAAAAASPATSRAAAGSSSAEALSRSAAYNGDAIRAQETSRETRHLAREKDYRKSLVQGPVLKITTQAQMRFSFNPSTLFDLGTDGTVYPEMTMSDEWGILHVTGGALFKDWKVVSVPLGTDSLRGPGWDLQLNPGWRVAAGSRRGDLALVRDKTVSLRP